MPDTFESLLVKLARARVEFLVAGGVAVCLNGFVRTTPCHGGHRAVGAGKRRRASLQVLKLI